MRILILIKYIIEDFITNRRNRKRIQKKLAKKHYYFHGNTSLLIPEDNDTLIGSTVITPKGIGKAYYLYPNREEIYIQMLQPYGWLKFNRNQCYYYAVYNRLLDKFIPLSPKCYTYIIDNHQPLFYRITKHGFAMLHDKYMEEHEHTHIFNSKRGGRSLLLHLKKEGYEIKKS